VRDANDRSEREEGYLARCERRGRVRELAQTERAREQQRERRGKRATSEQQPEREGRPEGGLSRQNHIVPRVSPPAKHQTTRSISHGTIMPFDLVSSSRYAFNHTGGSR